MYEIVYGRRFGLWRNNCQDDLRVHNQLDTGTTKFLNTKYNRGFVIGILS